MTVEERIVGVLEGTTSEALEDPRPRRLISGQMTRDDLPSEIIKDLRT